MSNTNRWTVGFLLLSASWFAGAEVQTLTPIREAPPAPELVLRDLDGKTHRLSAYRGQVVVVNFWATWCPPCIREMPSMERAWQHLRDENVTMLAVNVGEDADTVFTFLADYPVTFPLLMDEDASVTRSWPIRGLPTTYIVDRRGRLVYQAVGGRDWDHPTLLNKILELRDAPAATTAIAH